MESQGVNYFFEQTHFRKAHKRYKKQPEELPHDLRFAHLNPRVAAYLANKEKEAKGSQAGSFIDDGLGNKSLLPQINQTVSLIRQKLNDFLADEDAQRLLFEEAKVAAIDLFEQLASLLYSFEGIRPHIPKSLETQLLATFKELTANVKVVAREWQLFSNKEEHLQKQFLSSESSRDIRSERSDYPQSPVSFAMADDEDRLTARSEHKSRSRGSKTAHSRASQLGDILEDIDEDARSRTGRETASRVKHIESGGVPTIAAPSSRRLESRASAIIKTPKTRLEKFRSSISIEPGRPPSAASHVGMGRRATRLDHDTSSVMSHFSRMSEGNRSVMATNQGYWGVIQFQLSSKICQERGWIVNPSAEDDLERETVIEWATQRLQIALKQNQEQEAESKEMGLDGSVVLKFYGDRRREQIQKYKMGSISTRTPSAKALLKGEKPQIPSMKWRAEDKSLFMATVSDGSTTVCYPSGRPAIVTSKASLGKPGFYTIIYDNNVEQRMLGCFTPSGRGCCYHDNGVVRFLCTDGGGTIAELDGGIVKRWTWPPNPQKLPVTIVLQLNPHLTLRCVNLHQMQIIFNCQRENTKVNVGLVTGAEDVPSREEMGHLVSGIPLSSQAAKDFAKPYKPKSNKGKHKSKAKHALLMGFKPGWVSLGLNSSLNMSINSNTAGAGLCSVRETWDDSMSVCSVDSFSESTTLSPDTHPMSKSPVPTSELQKVLDFPETTENDTESDKDLVKLQRKIKNLVEDWLEHYRMAVGITSPYLKSVHDGRRPRDTASAKSSPGGVRVLIESYATQCPKPSVSTRAPSAPAGQRLRDRPGSTDTPRDRQGEQQSAVTFGEKPADEETVEIQSIPPTTPFQQSIVNGPTGGSTNQRTRSAPNRLILHTPLEGYSPSIGLCPVALRTTMIGGERGVTCRCSRHKIPHVTDLEFDEFTLKQAPPRQLVIVSIVSSLFPEAMHGQEMMEHLHLERNRNRTRPCLQSRNDAFRIVLYDIASAAELTEHSQPLLLRRHNIIPGMFLMYERGRLVFCDHIFNGYGNARKDFHKQVMQTRRSSSMGHTLPKDFRFSPIRGRHGPRSAWGGEIGGAGVDRHGSTGLSLDAGGVVKRSSMSSLSSGDSKDVSIDFHPRGDSTSRKFMSMSLTAAAYEMLARQETDISRDKLVAPSSVSCGLPEVHKRDAVKVL